MNLEDINYINIADVYKDNTFVGKILRTDRGSSFEYDQSYLQTADPNGGIAFHLPHTKKKYETIGVNLHTYFAGLLPEGLRFKALTKRVKTSEDDLLSLLIAAGGDCIGDVSVVPERQQILKIGIPKVNIKTLDKVLFSKLFEESIGYDSPQGLNTEPSIPGTQEKISAGMISFPIKIKKNYHSYILKLNPPNKPCFVENEYFFLQMARACGLIVPNTKLVKDSENNSGILIERFDRVVSSNTKAILKIHQEDACQFLNRYPSDKYLIKCSEIAEGLAKVCSSAPVEIARFLHLLAFSYLIGNGDMHAKNISVKTDSETNAVVMTPVYDLLSTLPYGDQRMALQFEGRNDNFKRAHFFDFGQRFGVNQAVVRSILDKIYEKSESWIDRVGEIGLDTKKIKYLKTVMTKRREDLAT